MTDASTLRAVLAAYGLPATATTTPLDGGLINKTFLVEDGARRAVLQRLHVIFKPTVHLDIEAITAHLEASGMPTPRLLRTTSGDLWWTDAEGGVWRLLSHLPGRTVHVVESEGTARAAGALVARFHTTVASLQHTFHFSRPGAHDTPEHLARLRRALGEHTGHNNYAAVAPVGEAILRLAEETERLPPVTTRIIHGDLKISNILFNDRLDEGVALVDLDTMAHLTIPIELGDAFRSWCNPSGEDESRATFRADIFSAAIEGYAPGVRGMLTREEIESLVLGAQTISMELAARFCADALNEAYFGWNAKKFPSRSEHNRVRALSQVSVALSVKEQRAALEKVVERAFR